ncbi:MAG: hypothetical protein M0Q53_06060 [Prolixibacteraceae bacterium]|nr:hypothetical protein [Prolixibacteraceae bacterium]
MLFFITLVLIAGIFAGWYFFAKESRYFGTSPLKAVPVEAPFFVRIRNLGEFAEKAAKSSCWKSMRDIVEVNAIYADFVFLDSIIKQSNVKENLLLHKELFFVPAAKEKLYLLEIESIAEKSRINALVRNYFLSMNIVSTTGKYQNSSIQAYEWSNNKGEKRFLFTFCRGIFVAATDRLTLCKAIDQLDQPSLLDDPDYRSINKNTAENTDINIYINHRTLPSYLSGFFADSSATGMLEPNYARWTEVDVIQKENQLLINGFTVTDSLGSCYLDAFRRQKPMTNSLIQWMPYTSSFFLTQNLSQPAHYIEDYTNYLQKNNKIGLYDGAVNEVSNKLNINISQYLKDNWTGEAAVVYTNQNLEDRDDNRFFLLKVKSGLNDPLVNAVIKRSDRSQNPQDIEFTEARKNNILKVPTDYFGKLIGDLYFGSVKTKWMIAGNGYLLMGPTPGSLIRYRNLIQRGALLEGNPSYLKSITGQAKTSNFYMWTLPGQSFPFFEPIIRSLPYKRVEVANKSIGKMENALWQWGFENGHFYNTASLFVNPDAHQVIVPFWMYPLKSKVKSRIQIVPNLLNSIEMGIIFQDQDNFLICLDREGSERWKINLEGPVLGEINAIEVNKDGVKQLLFNTRHAIHLLSGNGSEVKKFPVRLKFPATNGIVAIDYDGRRDYRFLVACSDRKVYNFDRSGKMIPGWQPKTSAGVVEFPVRHFTVGSKDYLVYFDRKHTYVVDRQGRERVKMRDEFVHSRNEVSMFKSQGMPVSMVTTDDRGNVWILGFDGSSKKIKTSDYSAGHFFLPVDFSGEGMIDFLYSDRQRLARYDASGKTIFDIKLDVNTDQPPLVIDHGGNKLIVLASRSDKKGILLKKDGSIFDRFQPDEVMPPFEGYFKDREDVVNWLVSSPEGYISNYQILLKNEK